jgi:RND family efflux transporter MFP subunit
VTKAKKVIIGIVVAVVVVSAALAVVAFAPREDLAGSVLTEAVQTRDVTTTVAASGVVEPIKELSVAFRQTGQLATIDVEVGQQVAEGQLLATLDPSDLDAAVVTAQAGVATARAAVVSATQAEAAAQLAINSADRELARAELSIAQARSAADNRREARDLANREKAAAEAQRSAAEAQMASARAQKIQAAMGVTSAQAQLEQAERARQDAELLAPMAGTVISIASQVGEPLSVGAGPTGGAFIVLADISEYVVVADFAEADVVGIEPGQEVNLTFDAIPGGAVTGTVLEVGLYGGVDPAGGRLTTYEVTVSVPTPPDSVRVGMTAQASITTESRSRVLAAPVTALVERDGLTFVQVLTAEGTISTIEVEVGIQGGYWIEIVSGLVGDERVITGSSGEIPVVGGGGFGGPPEGTPGGPE